VLATDLDPRFLAAIAEPNLVAEKHDIVNDPLPAESFDLIHCRLLLVHLPDRQQVLKRLVRALNPGGLLLCEKVDHTTFEPLSEVTPEVADLCRRYKQAELQSALAGGFDRLYGRRLYPDMVSSGLEAVQAEGLCQIFAGVDELFRLGLAHRRATGVEVHRRVSSSPRICAARSCRSLPNAELPMRSTLGQMAGLPGLDAGLAPHPSPNDRLGRSGRLAIHRFSD
jgi:SAM-dependent methyltransferase